MGNPEEGSLGFFVSLLTNAFGPTVISKSSISRETEMSLCPGWVRLGEFLLPVSE